MTKFTVGGFGVVAAVAIATQGSGPKGNTWVKADGTPWIKPDGSTWVKAP